MTEVAVFVLGAAVGACVWWIGWARHLAQPGGFEAFVNGFWQAYLKRPDPPLRCPCCHARVAMEQRQLFRQRLAPPDPWAIAHAALQPVKNLDSNPRWPDPPLTEAWTAHDRLRLVSATLPALQEAFARGDYGKPGRINVSFLQGVIHLPNTELDELRPTFERAVALWESGLPDVELPKEPTS